MEDNQPTGVREIQLTLGLKGHTSKLTVGVPNRSASMLELLPVLQDFTGAVVEMAKQVAEREGKSISCCAGCDACCFQLVPIAPVEAIHLEQVIEAMPEPRQSTIRKRFTEAVEQLQEEGMLERLEAAMLANNLDSAERQQMSDDYIGMKLPCPFLEEGSCSIYADRPLICREYLVTSPAVNCEHPTPETIDQLPLAAKPTQALTAHSTTESDNAAKQRWLPLPLALRFVAAVDQENWHVERPAFELITEFLKHAQPK